MAKTEILRSLVEGGRTLVLRRRGDALDVVLGNVVLLSSAALETERAFGRLAAPAFEVGDRVVIGGLGFGSTLRGVLEVAPPRAQIVVVEKLAAILDIARAEAAPLFDGALDDPRVTVVTDDVRDVLARERGLAAILLDVDNAPEWASFRTNAGLYDPSGLAAARAALGPGGTYAVWSGYAADAFVGRLRAAGFAPRIEPLKERGAVRARAYVGVNPLAPRP